MPVCSRVPHHRYTLARVDEVLSVQGEDEEHGHGGQLHRGTQDVSAAAAEPSLGQPPESARDPDGRERTPEQGG
jgi:hypothetical protein